MFRNDKSKAIKRFSLYVTHIVFLLGFLFCLKVNSKTLRRESCRSGEFTRQGTDVALMGHVIDISYVRGGVDCLMKCSEHAQCQSVNLEEVRDSFDPKTCEINDAKRENDSSALIARRGFSYYESTAEKNSIDCSSSPCLNGGTCFDGEGACLNQDPYCKCAAYYEGKYCETFNPPKTCKDIKNKDSSSDDGEYDLYLKWPTCSRQARIHCAAMNTDTPLEYVTLTAGSANNFAVRYNRDAGNRREETKFSKIRLKVPEMTVRIGDYRFASSNVNGVFHGYATAADCLSAGCTASYRKGTFKVDTTGTSFHLPDSIPYNFAGYPSCTKKLFSPSLSNDRTRWSAKCGGYCSSCWPRSFTLKLNGC